MLKKRFFWTPSLRPGRKWGTGFRTWCLMVVSRSRWYITGLPAKSQWRVVSLVKCPVLAGLALGRMWQRRWYGNHCRNKSESLEKQINWFSSCKKDSSIIAFRMVGLDAQKWSPFFIWRERALGGVSHFGRCYTGRPIYPYCYCMFMYLPPYHGYEVMYLHLSKLQLTVCCYSTGWAPQGCMLQPNVAWSTRP